MGLRRAVSTLADVECTVAERPNDAAETFKEIAELAGRRCSVVFGVYIRAVERLRKGHSVGEIVAAYPYLEAEDIPAALRYAAWRTQEQELPLSA